MEVFSFFLSFLNKNTIDDDGKWISRFSSPSSSSLSSCSLSCAPARLSIQSKRLCRLENEEAAAAAAENGEKEKTTNNESMHSKKENWRNIWVNRIENQPNILLHFVIDQWYISYLGLEEQIGFALIDFWSSWARSKIKWLIQINALSLPLSCLPFTYSSITYAYRWNEYSGVSFNSIFSSCFSILSTEDEGES